MARKAERGFDEWIRAELRLDPAKVVGGTRDVLRAIHGRHVALRRTEFVRRLNSDTRAAMRRREAGGGKITTNQTVEKWVEAGCPVNEDGSLSPLEVCSWLAGERKDGGGGRPGLAEKASGQCELQAEEREALVGRMRTCVDEGDVVGLIGLLMRECPDLTTAEAVSKIVVNIIGAEKSRVKAQADEYERKLRNGELLEVKVVERERIDRARFISEALDGLGSYAPRLQGMNVVQLRAELAVIGQEVLKRLAGEEE